MPLRLDTHFPMAHDAADATVAVSAMAPATSVLALKPVIVFMVLTLSLYLAQVISVQIRIYIPHLDVIEGDHRYVYKYGSSEIDGLFPLFGLWAFSGDGARVIEYSTENGHETLLRVHSVDLFSDFDKYSSHITRGLTSR